MFENGYCLPHILHLESMAHYSHYYHWVFNFKEPVIPGFDEIKTELFSVMGAKISEMKSKPILINGIKSHIHLLVSIHPSVAVAEVVQRVKLAATAFLKDKHPKCGFKGWREGYASITFNRSGLSSLIHYVETQEEHHKKENYKEEYLRF